jgi:hypothetical protein
MGNSNNGGGNGINMYQPLTFNCNMNIFMNPMNHPHLNHPEINYPSMNPLASTIQPMTPTLNPLDPMLNTSLNPTINPLLNNNNQISNNIGYSSYMYPPSCYNSFNYFDYIQPPHILNRFLN